MMSTLAVNLRGVFHCARAVHPGMVAAGGGAIVTVGSVMSELGLPGALHYVAAKAGVVRSGRPLGHRVDEPIAPGRAKDLRAEGAVRWDRPAALSGRRRCARLPSALRGPTMVHTAASLSA